MNLDDKKIPFSEVYDGMGQYFWIKDFIPKEIEINAKINLKLIFENGIILWAKKEDVNIDWKQQQDFTHSRSKRIRLSV